MAMLDLVGVGDLVPQLGIGPGLGKSLVVFVDQLESLLGWEGKAVD